jgi:hypothetical protein
LASLSKVEVYISETCTLTLYAVQVGTVLLHEACVMTDACSYVALLQDPSDTCKSVTLTSGRTTLVMHVLIACWMKSRAPAA